LLDYNLQTKFPENKFIRIHRSYIIALSKVSTFQKSIDKKILPIGETYKQRLLDLLN